MSKDETLYIDQSHDLQKVTDWAYQQMRELCDAPGLPHPDTAFIADELLDWALSTGLCSPRSLMLLRKLAVAHQVGICLPAVSTQTLRIVVRYSAWLTVFDREVAEDPARLAELRD